MERRRPGGRRRQECLRYSGTAGETPAIRCPLAVGGRRSVVNPTHILYQPKERLPRGLFPGTIVVGKLAG